MSNASQPERISDAEQAVMEAVWSAGRPIGAADVAKAVGEERDWSLATVKTLLSRLVAKDALAAQPEGRRFLYTARIERADFVGRESKRLVERLFGGRAASLVAHLAEAEALSAKDIAEIEVLLKGLKKDAGR
ncbi:BlaI/MecI/CopY family transcriptional regulator [Croceicoccus naphthovorans]|uniref:CopY family transcriptional repressor n=1 Tax=Croceicoccus naphthovorans TaxID=1348774 RepID=A0A0G3XGZ5_9SPHN|nr:BlaI/MecI/CopY family transcriptional regulator [Croceicoccus naphthovorans]AKM10472.1 CopY family transcriptional repressor [Croceicoccus naphthovorans]MBB3988646.1 putative transcriptional regulator [Croceicoccus naphthovorans]